MEIIIEFVLQFLIELFYQLLAEICCEFGTRWLSDSFKGRRVQNPFLAALGYFILGSSVGAISLLIVHSSLIHSSALRLVNLILVPLIAGLVMLLIGFLRQKKGQPLVRLDRFTYGFIFAFGMALVRFIYATKPA
jgi:hypothetical protein